MELGSESAQVLPSSNDGQLDGSFGKKKSPPCSGPPGIAVERDETISKDPLYMDEFCGEGPSNGVMTGRLDNETQASLPNCVVKGGRASEALKICDHGLGAVPDILGSSENIGGLKIEMEEGENVPSWMSMEKITPSNIVPERTSNIMNLAINHNTPENTSLSSCRRTFFMVRMPRGADSELRSKIKLAELQLEEAFKTRDVIRAALQLRRASKIELLDKLKVVRDKERACKDEFQKKRSEIDPLQIALNRLKLADTKYKEDEIFSEEDLDKKIARLQHRIQHESIPLKEEKQLIREIKQLESHRSQVCANDAEHAYLLESYGPKEDIQDNLDILYRELDALRSKQNQARMECKPIEKDLEDLNVKIDELVDQLEAAKRCQASALAACKDLKKNVSQQNAEFYKYKDDFRKAKELASSKNLEGLAAFCHEQVESMMRCWNRDSSFRERYMKNNVHSTLRRLETLDGRSLGLDEEPSLVLSDAELATETPPKDVETGSKKVGSQKEAMAKSPVSFVEVNKPKGLQGSKAQQPQEKILQRTGTSKASISQKKEANTKTKTSGGALSQSSSNRNLQSSLALLTAPVSPAPAPSPTPVEDAAAKEARAAELKEKRRQEEMAKAQEAVERKRRQAERVQAKAQLRAQKEAERREKERAKKAKRKAEVGVKEVQTVETIEEKEKELATEELTKASGKQLPSDGKRKQLKSRREPVLSSILPKLFWQLPSTWLWVSILIILVILAVVFVAKFWS